MGNGAKIGLVGVLALIVLVVAVWDKSNEDARKADDLRSVPLAPVKAPEPNARVKPLPELPPPEHVRGQLDHDGPLVVRQPVVEPREAPARADEAARPQPAAAAPAPVATAPAAQPAPAASAPAAPEPKRYVIQPRDTLSSIAAQHLGDRNQWKVIFEANRDRLADPDRLPLGKEIVIPSAPPASVASSAGLAGAERRVAGGFAPETEAPPGSHTYVVRRGETLTQIAEETLGSGKMWKRIYEANKDRLASPDSLREGQVLVIPAR